MTNPEHTGWTIAELVAENAKLKSLLDESREYVAMSERNRTAAPCYRAEASDLLKSIDAQLSPNPGEFAGEGERVYRKSNAFLAAELCMMFWDAERDYDTYKDVAMHFLRNRFPEPTATKPAAGARTMIEDFIAEDPQNALLIMREQGDMHQEDMAELEKQLTAANQRADEAEENAKKWCDLTVHAGERLGEAERLLKRFAESKMRAYWHNATPGLSNQDFFELRQAWLDTKAFLQGERRDEEKETEAERTAGVQVPADVDRRGEIHRPIEVPTEAACDGDLAACASDGAVRDSVPQAVAALPPGQEQRANRLFDANDHDELRYAAERRNLLREEANHNVILLLDDMAVMDAELAALRKQVAEGEKDTKRIEWMEENGVMTLFRDLPYSRTQYTFRVAIDTAMAAQESKAHG